MAGRSQHSDQTVEFTRVMLTSSPDDHRAIQVEMGRDQGIYWIILELWFYYGEVKEAVMIKNQWYAVASSHSIKCGRLYHV